MPVNRPLATLLAAIALLLAIVAAVVVLSDPRPTTPAPFVTTPGDGQRVRQRAHAQPERRSRDAPEPADVVPPAGDVERLPWVRGSGFVVGTITDRVTGDPVRDVLVRLLHPTGEEIAAGTSDHAGRYQVEGVPDTLPLVLHIAHEGHLSGLCCDVRLRDSEILRKDIALIRAPRVVLHLSDRERHRAAADVPVRVLDGSREVARATSDEQGRVELVVVEQGLFDLRVGGGGWAPRPAEELRLQPGLGDVALQRSVERGGGLEISVRDREDQPVGGAEVSVRGQGLEPVSAATDGRGELTLGPFPTGTALRVIASADEGRMRAATLARARTGYDETVRLTLLPTARVSGVVRGASGRPLRNAVVEIVVPEDGAPLGTARTDAQGRFAVGDLPPGEVEVVIRAAAHVASRLRAYASTERGVDVRMQAAPSATLVGRVLGPRRRPVDGARVRVVPGDVETRSGPDGAFELEGVPPDVQQRILVAAPGLRVTEGGRADRLLVTLAEDERHRVEIVLEPLEEDDVLPEKPETEIRVATGRIVSGNGAPVAAATVTWAGLAQVTGTDGRFRLERPERDHRAAAPLLAITPPAGLLEPETLPLGAPDADGVSDVERVGLRERPTCRLRLGGGPATTGRSFSFALLMDTDDHLLGRDTEPFAARTCVTYDGTWLHVAAPHAWRRGGHRGAWVGLVTTDGPLAAPLSWPAAAGGMQVVAPVWRDAASKVDIRVPQGYRGGTLRLRLDTPAGGAPFERLGLPLEIRRDADRTRVRLQWLARGVWIADLIAPTASASPTLRTTISDGRVSGFRPAR